MSEGCKGYSEGRSFYIVVSGITELCYQDSNKVQHHFSSEWFPTLWHALPAIKELQTMWEVKCNSTHFSLYKDASTNGLEKLKKYYSCFDKKPSYILALGMFSFDIN